MAINDNTSYELFGYQVKDLATKIKSKAEASSLAPVATSGLYTDLIGAPTIPTVYNGKLTITQNGATVGEFTANQSTDTTINLTSSDSSYSTSEVKTSGTWIDGKPIYKKTTNVGALPNNASKSVSHGIANLERIIKSEGWALASDGTELPLPYADIVAAGSVCIYATSTAVRIAAGADRSGFSGYVTLYYTKTTD